MPSRKMKGDDLRLPESVQEIADVIGREKALFLIGQLPQSGSRSWRVCLYVPRKIRADHKLVQILGWHDAQKLVAEFGGMILQPSNCNQVHRDFRNQCARKMQADGMKPQEIADAIGLSIWQVKRVLDSKTPEERLHANDNTKASKRA